MFRGVSTRIHRISKIFRALSTRVHRIRFFLLFLHFFKKISSSNFKIKTPLKAPKIESHHASKEVSLSLPISRGSRPDSNLRPRDHSISESIELPDRLAKHLTIILNLFPRHWQFGKMSNMCLSLC